jgi:hypothetical protein
MTETANAVEIISFNSNNPSSIVWGTFTCKLVFYSCRSMCGVPINYNVTILLGPNNDWHHYSGVVSMELFQNLDYFYGNFILA